MAFNFEDLFDEVPTQQPQQTFQPPQQVSGFDFEDLLQPPTKQPFNFQQATQNFLRTAPLPAVISPVAGAIEFEREVRQPKIVQPLARKTEELLGEERVSRVGTVTRQALTAINPIINILNKTGFGLSKKQTDTIDRQLGSFTIETLISIATDPLIWISAVSAGKQAFVSKTGIGQRLANRAAKVAARKSVAGIDFSKLTDKQIVGTFGGMPKNISREVMKRNPRVKAAFEKLHVGGRLVGDAPPTVKPVQPKQLTFQQKQILDAPKSPKIVFRATDKTFDPKMLTDEGLFVSSNRDIAKAYQTPGRIIEELVVDPKAKILTFENTPKEFYRKDGKFFIPRDGGDGLEIAKYAKARGFDIVEYHNPEGLVPEAAIVNKNIVTPVHPTTPPEITKTILFEETAPVRGARTPRPDQTPGEGAFSAKQAELMIKAGIRQDVKTIPFREDFLKQVGQITQSDLTDEGKIQLIQETFKPFSQFPNVPPEFLELPKGDIGINSYFTPQEYTFKRLGLEETIRKPISIALQEAEIETAKVFETINNARAEYEKTLVGTPQEKEAAIEALWEAMDKGLAVNDQSPAAKVLRLLRKQNAENLVEVNATRRAVGLPEVVGLKNYILHEVKEDILNSLMDHRGTVGHMRSVIKRKISTQLFLKTTLQRKGVPEEWLKKDPFELTKVATQINKKYAKLQRALKDADPYIKAVQGFRVKLSDGNVDTWSPRVHDFLQNWIERSIKRKPSKMDDLINKSMETILAPILNTVGVQVSNIPFTKMVNLLVTAEQVGALGARLRPVLRNLVQSSFDWVLYGTKNYIRGSAMFFTNKGQEILRQTKTWHVRVPFIDQDAATMHKIFKVGSVPYSMADLHNVGKSLLTLYRQGVDDLKLTHSQAIQYIDDNFVATQWSYRREDLPPAFSSSSGKGLWALGSWWMNYYNRFLPDMLRRTFLGVDPVGRKVTPNERMAGLRFAVLVGLLYGVKKSSQALIGTAIDYTGQVTPTIFRQSPIAQYGASAIKFSQGLMDDNARQMNEGLRGMLQTGKIFIPFALAIEELFDLVSGNRSLANIAIITKKTKGVTLGDVVKGVKRGFGFDTTTGRKGRPGRGGRKGR